MENEIWRDIPGYEGLYQASSLGRIRGLKGLRKQQLTKDGYYRLSLYKNHKKATITVHRLVWAAFYGEIPQNMEVNHINEIKTDNRLNNLNLLKHKDNMTWGTRLERLKSTMTNNPKKSKRIIQYDCYLDIIKEYPSISEAARETGYSIGNICMCCQGRLKQAYGYTWKYVE